MAAWARHTAGLTAVPIHHLRPRRHDLQVTGTNQRLEAAALAPLGTGPRWPLRAGVPGSKTGWPVVMFNHTHRCCLLMSVVLSQRSHM